VKQKFSSLVDLLRYRAIHQSKKTAFIFLRDGEIESARLTYEDLDLHARAIAASLQLRVKAGDRVMLLYPSGLEFISAFFGCLYAGVIAVPAHLPRRNRHSTKIKSILIDAKAELVLTTSSVLENTKRILETESSISIIDYLNTDTIDCDQANTYKFPEINTDTIAFLQYTSGSTGTPKGVIVTHGNLLHNEQMIQKAFGHDADTIFVGWLPLFHDMGLIGNILQPLYLGITSILMSPAAFLQKPSRWLQAISHYKATTSGGPNFAYDLCVEKIQAENLSDIDLSSWIVAFNGAEPIKANTIKQFADRFKFFGFKKQAFYPCYGMAESTLFITGGDSDLSPIIHSVEAKSLKRKQVVEAVTTQAGSRELVGSGHSWSNQKILLVDPESCKLLKEGQIGEIWISSDSVAKGYWNRPEETKKTFAACLMHGSESFLRTGDMGFLKDNELFITGRLKDLIIIRGRNHYPQDIEQTVERSHFSLRSNSGAAFSVEIEGAEKLVVIQEVKRTHLRKLNLDKVFKSIYQAVSAEHELAVETVVLLKPGQIPKTTSGKIQRYLCRQQFSDSTLQGVVATKSTRQIECKSVKFSILYFSSNEAELVDDKYHLLIEGAKFADNNDFHAVWIPERHFHPFGGLYPESSVLGSALAMITEKIRIRSGSVVLPIQNPIRVAEQWSVVDNLSKGRVDISFARGWNPNDFVLAPQNYANRTSLMWDGIKLIRKLWKGESIKLPNGKGDEIETKIYPSPKQSELPFWITCSGGKERFIEAGAAGANILTALLFQPVEALAEKIALYRKSRLENGYDPKTGQVTIMLHTFVSSEIETVREKVKKPFIEYLRSSIDLWSNNSENLSRLTKLEQDKVLDYAFERYFQTAALMGTPSTCLTMIDKLKQVGVDEVACLIDFGVDEHSVISNLPYLNMLRQIANQVEDIQDLGSTELLQKDNKCELAENNNFSNSKYISNIIRKILSVKLNIDIDSIDSYKDFAEYGLDSLKAIEFVEDLNNYLECSVESTLLWDFPTIASLSEYVFESLQSTRISGQANSSSFQEIEVREKDWIEGKI
jgi:natural product biosynthesis luciferase-like monooxygenase protein